MSAGVPNTCTGITAATRRPVRLFTVAPSTREQSSARNLATPATSMQQNSSQSTKTGHAAA